MILHLRPGESPLRIAQRVLVSGVRYECGALHVVTFFQHDQKNVSDVAVAQCVVTLHFLHDI